MKMNYKIRDIIPEHNLLKLKQMWNKQWYMGKHMESFSLIKSMGYNLLDSGGLRIVFTVDGYDDIVFKFEKSRWGGFHFNDFSCNFTEWEISNEYPHLHHRLAVTYDSIGYLNIQERIDKCEEHKYNPDQRIANKQYISRATECLNELSSQITICDVSSDYMDNIGVKNGIFAVYDYGYFKPMLIEEVVCVTCGEVGFEYSYNFDSNCKHCGERIDCGGFI